MATIEELIKLAETHKESKTRLNDRLDRMVRNGMDRDIAIGVLFEMYNSYSLRTYFLRLRK